MSIIREVKGCRICGNTALEPIISLGDQYLTGVFPRDPDMQLTHGPLELVRCTGAGETCGLVQLRHSFDTNEMYGESYGYRSALNRSMVVHLRNKVNALTKRVPLEHGDLVLDIGSNDGTTLSFYSSDLTRVGFDPSAGRLREHYPDGSHCIVDFFSSDRFLSEFGGRKAKVITSIAMFYDLESPQGFLNEVESVLDDDGIWHFEQSYLPSMLDLTAYDTICHEHLEYYALSQIEWMIQRSGLKLLDVELNEVNGGSFAITVCKSSSSMEPNHIRIEDIRREEEGRKLSTPDPFEAFQTRVQLHRADLSELIGQLSEAGRTVLGYGASTKGNVLLQYCDIGPSQLRCIADVNPDKFGCYTPGTRIPIVSEADARAMQPDFFLVMPWHFRENLIQRESEFLASGGNLIFPLPHIDVVRWQPK